jgi:CHAT domain-containing protein/tetratricopeptide (TPR) repeat protein
MPARPSVARRLRRLTAALLLSAACLTPMTEARADAEVDRLIAKTEQYYRQSVYRQAEITALNALDRATEVLGERHPDTLTSLNNYAAVLNRLGRAVEAEPLFKRALELRTEVLGERHPDTLTSLSNYAGVLESLGKAAEAEPLYKRALELNTEVLGGRHPDTLSSLNNYAGVLKTLGRVAEAEPLHKRAVDTRAETQGKRHPDTLISINKYANVLNLLGRSAEAEPMLKRVLDLNIAVLSERHPDALTSLSNYAGVLDALGRTAESEAIHKRALDLRIEVLGERHPDTLSSLNNYAFALGRLGRAAEAEPLYKRALELRTEVLGERHPDTLAVALNHVAILLRLDRTDEALERLAWGIDRLHDWSGGEMQAMSRDAGRRELMLRNSHWIDVILSVALQRPSPRSIDLAAQTVLRWKQRTTEEDALLERLIRRSGDPEIRRQAEDVANLRRNVAALAPNDDNNVYAATAERLDAALRDLRRTLRDPAMFTAAQTATPAAVAGRLPDGAVLVEFRVYHPTDFTTAELAPLRLAAVVLERNRPPLIYDAGAVADLNERIAPAAGGDKTAANELFKLAFGPAAERLKAVKTVFIAPDGPLWDVAPAVLRAAPTADYWLKDQSLRIIATGRDLLTPAFTPAAGGLVVVGGVDYGKASSDGGIEKVVPNRRDDSPAALSRAVGFTLLMPLPHSGREASYLKELYGAGPIRETVTLLDGAKATEAALKRLTKPPKVLHLATHGDYRSVKGTSDRPDVMSWVALAGANRGLRGEVDADGEDGLLTALEAAALPLDGTALVALSACKTGVGGKDYSEGPIGLVRAFRIAGARHVLAALRNVADDLTADFMIEFHRTWLAGGMKDPHEALRKVQISFADDPDPRKSNPGFWGAFVVIGP